MDFDKYQALAKELDRGQDSDLLYPIVGLVGELGEVSEPIKKWYRGDGKKLDIEYLKLELGDVLWYLTTLTRRLGLTLDEVAQANIAKLQERKKKDKPVG